MPGRHRDQPAPPGRLERREPSGLPTHAAIPTRSCCRRARDTDPREAAADRNHAISTARDLLKDPTTLILAINTIGKFQPRNNNLERRTAITEITAIDTRGRTVLDVLLRPYWESLTGERGLRRCGLTPKLVKAYDVDHYWDEPSIHKVIDGRRVVCVDRAVVYGAFYCEEETATGYGPYPNGFLNPITADTLQALSSTLWECSRILSSLFHGVWFEPIVRPSLTDVPAPQRAGAQTRGILRLLRDIAASAQEPMVKPTLLRRRYPTRRRATFRQEFVRDPAKRALVIDRSNGRCENPECPDTGYLLDRTFAGEPLLQIDHITPLGRGGEDEIINMIAVCGNCHERKTRGHNRAALEHLFRSAILAKHRRLLGLPR